MSIVEFGELSVQVEHRQGQPGDERGRGGFAPDAYLLRRRGIGGRLCELGGVANLAVSQPPFKPFRTDVVDGLDCLEAADQHKRTLVGEVQCPFQRRENAK